MNINNRSYKILEMPEGNSLLHIVTREYGITLYESKQNSSIELKHDLSNFSRMFYLLCEHGSFPSTLNTRIVTNYKENLLPSEHDEKIADNIGNVHIMKENAYDYANKYLAEYINNRTRNQNGKNRKIDTNNHFLPNIFLLQTALKCIPTHSVFASEFKDKILQSCEKAQNKINSIFSQVFDSETIKELTHCVYFSVLVLSCHEASQELSDMIVVEKFKSLNSERSKVEFIKKLLDALGNIINKEKFIMLTTPKQIIDELNRDNLIKVQNERNQAVKLVADERIKSTTLRRVLKKERKRSKKQNRDNIAAKKIAETSLMTAIAEAKKSYDIELENRKLKELLAEQGIILPENPSVKRLTNVSMLLPHHNTLFPPPLCVKADVAAWQQLSKLRKNINTNAQLSGEDKRASVPYSRFISK